MTFQIILCSMIDKDHIQRTPTAVIYTRSIKYTKGFQETLGIDQGCTNRGG
jgi:hypothetical protein